MSSSSSTSSPPVNVRVGVGCFVLNDEKDKILIGMRTGSHGANTIALPGGHLEMFENFEDCAMREIKEECNLDLDPTSMKLMHVSNDMFKDLNKHYVTIFMRGQILKDSTELKNMEPHKCLGLEWIAWEDLKEDLRPKFVPLQNICNVTDFNPFDGV